MCEVKQGPVTLLSSTFCSDFSPCPGFRLHGADVKDAINASQTKVVEGSSTDLVVITVCVHGTTKM